MTMTRTELAIEMIARGADVFPLAPGKKTPLTKNGFKDAHHDVEMAKTFLGHKGKVNYGVVWPDEPNPVFLWDVDGGNGHDTWRDDWKALNDELGRAPRTLTSITPSDGRHLIFRWRTDLYGPHPDSDQLLGFTVRWPDKGYGVGPGSEVDGKVYESNLADIVDFPEAWAIAAIERSKKKRTNGSNGAEWPQGHTGAGGRYHAIRTYQATYYNRGLSQAQIRALVHAELAPTFNPALTAAEVDERFDRAWKDIEERLGAPRRAQGGEAASDAGYSDMLLKQLPSAEFPAEPDDIAFDGLAGEAVWALQPYTTASRVGLLASMLTISGAVLSVTTEYYGTQPSSFMTALVGESGLGKKGTAMAAAWRALTAADAFGPQPELEIKGLGSGEGIVGHAHRALKADPNSIARMLLTLEELGDALVVKGREGNTLGSYLRQGFDRVGLANITKQQSLVVPREKYQLGLLGAITPDELRDQLAKTADIANGFANRILWVPVQGRVDEKVRGQEAAVLPHPQAAGFMAALTFVTGNRGSPFTFDDDAFDVLSDYYAMLSKIKGTPGVLTRRQSTIAARIALVHAVLERRRSIDVGCVERAIALTEYARSGLTWIFGPTIAGSPDAERLLRVLLTVGRPMKRSDLATAAWRTHWNADRVDKALDALQRNGLVDTTRLETGKAGRPATLIALSGSAEAFHRFSNTRAREEQHEAPVNAQIWDDRPLEELAELALKGVISREDYHRAWQERRANEPNTPDSACGHPWTRSRRVWANGKPTDEIVCMECEAGGNGESEQKGEGENRGGIGVGKGGESGSEGVGISDD